MHISVIRASEGQTFNPCYPRVSMTTHRLSNRLATPVLPYRHLPTSYRRHRSPCLTQLPRRLVVEVSPGTPTLSHPSLCFTFTRLYHIRHHHLFPPVQAEPELPRQLKASSPLCRPLNLCPGRNVGSKRARSAFSRTHAKSKSIDLLQCTGHGLLPTAYDYLHLQISYLADTISIFNSTFFDHCFFVSFGFCSVVLCRV